jgi:hypothetical protein
MAILIILFLVIFFECGPPLEFVPITEDLPVVQTLVLLIAFVFVFVNLITDLLYAWLDPRISYR